MEARETSKRKTDNFIRRRPQPELMLRVFSRICNFRRTNALSGLSLRFFSSDETKTLPLFPVKEFILKNAGDLSSSFTRKASTPQDVGKLFLETFGEQKDSDVIDVAIDVMGRIDATIPYSSYHATVALIQHFCSKGDVETAWRYYIRPNEKPVVLDFVALESFVSKLCDRVMLDEVQQLLGHSHHPTLSMLHKMAEPYILSGRIHDFAQHLSAGLHSRHLRLDFGELVTLVEYILQARIQRAMSGSPMTLSEMEGAQQIFDELNMMADDLHNMEWVGDGDLNDREEFEEARRIVDAYLSYCDTWDGESIQYPSKPSTEGSSLRDPFVPGSSFKYLVEHRRFYDQDLFLEESPFDVMDITAELAENKMNPPLLYSSDLFYNARNDDGKFVATIRSDALGQQLDQMDNSLLENVAKFWEKQAERFNVDFRKADGRDFDVDEEIYQEDDDVDFDSEDDLDDYDDDEEDDSFGDEQRFLRDVRRKRISDVSVISAGLSIEEMNHLLASDMPHRRIQDLSRSLFLAFGRYKPAFDENFFLEMETSSYQDPSKTPEATTATEVEP